MTNLYPIDCELLLLAALFLGFIFSFLNFLIILSKRFCSGQSSSRGLKSSYFSIWLAYFLNYSFYVSIFFYSSCNWANLAQNFICF